MSAQQCLFVENFRNRLATPTEAHPDMHIAFRHALFPATFADQAKEYSEQERSLNRAAAAGYRLFAHRDTQWDHARTDFVAQREWLQGLPQVPHRLLGDRIALLGLALGECQVGVADEETGWWWDLLRQLEGLPAMTRFAHFLRMLLWPNRRYQFAPPDDYLGLAAYLLRSPDAVDRQVLADYLVRIRKEEVPYDINQPEIDFLKIYVADAAIRVLIQSEQLVRRAHDESARVAREETEKKWMDALSVTLARRARRVVVGLTLSGCLLVVASCTYLFVSMDAALQLQGVWDTIKWACLAFSGPLGFLALVVRLLTFGYQGRPWTADYVKISEVLHRRLLRQWQRRLTPPSPPSPPSHP